LYLTYGEFTTFGGSGVSEEQFPRLAYRAEKLLDLETHSRVKAMSEVPEAVKRALVELIMIDVNNADVLNGGGAVKSFSTDGYSETVEAMTVENINALKGNVLYELLAEEEDDNGTPLLYMGVEV